MIAEWTPMRWPSAWTNPSALSLLKGTAVDCLLIDKTTALDPVRAAAVRQGLHVDPPPAVHIVKGEWPGIRLSRDNGSDATAGPTGVPWVDSNGWQFVRTPGRQFYYQVTGDAARCVRAREIVSPLVCCHTVAGRQIVPSHR